MLILAGITDNFRIQYPNLEDVFTFYFHFLTYKLYCNRNLENIYGTVSPCKLPQEWQFPLKLYMQPAQQLYMQPAQQVLGSSGHKKNRAREKGTRVSPSIARVRSLFCPLLPSACYAGYYTCNYISLTCSFFFCFFLFHYLAPSICLEMILPSGQRFHKKHFKVP